jgi:Zn finger protein HypA/HybF involved in hydrogenase expression
MTDKKMDKDKIETLIHELKYTFRSMPLEDEETLRFAIECMDKQIPTEHLYCEVESYTQLYLCPICEEEFTNYRKKYCWKCGKLLKGRRYDR